jgi:DNA-binding transcriptional ArsR family regulator
MSNRSDVVDLLDRCAASLHPEHVRPLLGSVLDQATADEVASTFAVLADPTRARIVHALSLAEELCVCDLALLLGVSESAMSHQLRLLRDHRVVTRRRAGRVAYYRLADGHVRHILADGTRHALERGSAEDPVQDPVREAAG